MSTFNGIIKEIPNISIDRFDNNNLNSTVFFLSHCHTDQMVGLSNATGLPGPLFTSDISAVIMKHTYPNITKVETLQIGMPTPIHVPSAKGEKNSVKITVTTFPAGHCPGSVMFYIESENNIKILYTGDIRLRENDLSQLKIFSDPFIVDHLSCLYVDSTFLSTDYKEFPSQFDSIKAVCELIQEWIKKSRKHSIWIRTPARYGSEYLFFEIARQTKQKLHISADQLIKYKYIPEMDNIFTINPNGTQIHACCPANNNFICDPMDSRKFLRIIRPTALIWKKWHSKKSIILPENNETYRVCYSSHSSYQEIKDMILRLRPKNIELNVLPECDKEKYEMEMCLQEIMREFIKPESYEKSYKPMDSISFGNIKININSGNENIFEDSDDDNNDDKFVVIDLPNKKR